MSNDYSISVAAYFQSLDEECPDHICFSVNLDSHLTIFSLFKGLSRFSNVKDMNLWDFYIMHTANIESDTITLPKLLSMNPYHIAGSDLQ